MSLTITDNSVVSIHYTLADPEGDIIDRSEPEEPLVYLHGAKNIIVGLEKALLGKAVGEKLEVTILAPEAYGEHDDTLVEKVPLNLFEGGKVEPGMTFQAQTDDPDQVRHIVVTAVEEETVTVDANHPLAGVDLTFNVEIVAVREASPEEIDHGHVHHH